MPSDSTTIMVVADDVTEPWDHTTLVSQGGLSIQEVTVINNGTPLPNGGTTGQALVKASDADDDVEWGTVSGGTSFQPLNNIQRQSVAVSFPILTMANNTSYSYSNARMDDETTVGSTGAVWSAANSRFDITATSGLFVATAGLEVDSKTAVTGQVYLNLIVDDDAGFGTGFQVRGTYPHTAGYISVNIQTTFYAEENWRVYASIENSAVSAGSPTWEYGYLTVFQIL